MTSNLLLGYSDITAEYTVTYNNTEDSTYKAVYLFGGNKAERFQASAAASGDHRFTFTAASTNKASNFLYIGKANLLQQASVGTVTLKGHTANNYAAGTTVYNDASFASATLYGPASEDYIQTFATSSTFQYWFMNYNASSSSKVPHAKLFFGSYVDPGKDPVQVSVRRVRPSCARRRASYLVDLKWSGVAYATAVSMNDVFGLRRKYTPIVLFTTTWHGLFDGFRVLFGRVVEFAAVATATDVFEVTMSFEELI